MMSASGGLRPVYVCDAVRTPFGRYGGALAGVRADDLAAEPLRALQARNRSVDWGAIDDVILGCANQAGEDNRNVARMASLLAGLPERVPGVTVNRLCASSLEACIVGARAIATGEQSLVIAGGVESMSRAPYVMAKPQAAYPRDLALVDTTLGWRFVNPQMEARYGIDSMAETAEHVAGEHRVCREDQDRFAHRSQARAGAAAAAGLFREEIVPIAAPQPRGPSLEVTADEHPRPGTTIEMLARLKPIVRPDGTVTAGNASGINDGSCALLLASEEAVRAHGLTPRARYVASAVAGVAPRVMGIGPVPAVQALLARTHLTIEQIDLIELNEAFAAQALAVLRALGVPDDAPHVNPNGGAIALGHPLGASGARLVTTAIAQLQRTHGRYALCTMCVGVGQGVALLLERA
jgi:acetyl-CoA acyltransferase